MTTQARRLIRFAIASVIVVVGVKFVNREIRIHEASEAAREVYDVVTSTGGYLVTHELSPYWTINIESATFNELRCRRLRRAMDGIPD